MSVTGADAVQQWVEMSDRSGLRRVWEVRTRESCCDRKQMNKWSLKETGQSSGS